MKKLVISYGINGSTQNDVWTAAEVAFQRDGEQVMVRFPLADGAMSASTQSSKRSLTGVSVVSYSEAYWVCCQGQEATGPES